ncbi:NAD(P)H-dependent glycerol-3-phosphate dehydrogenase [Geomonas paludis]|uniref:Glycerol-3-phosphate dehydrogenase [NAD(P)+] n=1 Tax=Geomonas paludis TaxID=2740185 RepID=A0A6V8MQF4_9BACT|nr:NAD(P)H-dependent glycerol-3-phosphate dehydrogenase [Geomonas paludis]UPU36139.1 NAD(P)H-dependent glycerol-3-phosphate dehydrogenase [Geomonas paludis]GFO62251.1 glycerol-3-phosphate dehydrogenase [NAD(P)+] [Geomonas paludis]
MLEKVAVIGAGSWGTTLADLLAKKGHQVTLWAYEPELVVTMRETRENNLFLPGITLQESLAFTNDLEEAYRGCTMVLCVVPSQLVRRVITNSLPFIPKEAVIISASKGIEVDTLATVSEIYQQILPPEMYANFAALSGPSFAREVAQEMPTAVAAAAATEAIARRVQEAFNTNFFRVYRNSDVVGVELGGAIKNVIAIAAGISDGLGFGSNTRAALITRGLAEMTRLGLAMGAQPATFAGLAGMGDLVLTCTGDLSRNRSVGIQIGQGRSLDEILGEMRMVAEGVKTTESAYNLAKKLGVEMPIIDQMYQMLYQNKPAREAVLELMTRNLKAEGA